MLFLLRSLLGESRAAAGTGPAMRLLGQSAGVRTKDAHSPEWLFWDQVSRQG